MIEKVKRHLRLVVRESPASKEVNAEAEEFKALGSVMRLRLMKTERGRKRSISASRSEF
jgi:hypothetical protein